MTTFIEQYIQDGKKTIEDKLKSYLQGNIPEKLYASMAYSLFADGKRLRPILLFASYHSYRDDLEKVYRTAAALEMIHTYSLIHDDLPAMDDDDYRRGMLTNHKKFDEATAILAGDALLTYSFELVASDPLLSENEKVYIIRELAKSSGPEGMVAGQILDIEGETKRLNLEELERVHQLKTGKLISFAVDAGAFLAGASEEQRRHLRQFSHYLGLIFQVQDDILDVIGDEKKLGKPVGSDTAKQKSTYPALLGLDGAKQKMDEYNEKAKAALVQSGAKQEYLIGLLEYFGSRDY
ncbi:MAG: polyprenyl synthetase family protein [Bacilli bacterium]|nr:polyprenyl synthetase family protein [Bacilli bacterium]